MKRGIAVLLWMMCWVHVCWAQEISIEYGPLILPVDQYFTISVKGLPSRTAKVEGFPEIEGFQKSTTSLASFTYKTGNVTTKSFTLTQRYAPLREGEFALKAFNIQVNGKVIAAKAVKIKVGAVATPTPLKPDTARLAPEIALTPEFVEVQENAFLKLYLPKERVYVGEGVPVSLWFYVAESDLNLLDFYDFEPQILKITGQLKQRSVWEEVLEQPEIKAEKVQVGSKAFTRYKLYEAVLFPITAQALRFPEVNLRMIKYKVAKNPSLLTQTREQEFTTYHTSPERVEVRSLPPHPLRDQVAVGNFRLREQLSRKSASLNQNFVYQFQIEGEGNIETLPPPQTQAAVEAGWEIYPPEIRQYTSENEGRITGTKTFRYFMVGREAGEFPLRNLFQWVYFNPVTARYDTLRPSVTIQVRGKEDQNAFIRAQDVGNFYNIIETEGNELTSLDQFREERRYTNIALIAMLGLSLFIFIKRNS